MQDCIEFFRPLQMSGLSYFKRETIRNNNASTLKNEIIINYVDIFITIDVDVDVYVSDECYHFAYMKKNNPLFDRHNVDFKMQMAHTFFALKWNDLFTCLPI